MTYSTSFIKQNINKWGDQRKYDRETWSWSDVMSLCDLVAHYYVLYILCSFAITHPFPRSPPCLSTSVRCHFWCSPGYSTSLPPPEKSSSSSCSVWASRLPLGSRLARLKTWKAETSPAGPGHSARAAARLLRPRKEPGGLPGRKRRRDGEESGYLWALRPVARYAGCPPL